MNTTADDMPRRRGLLETIKGLIVNVMGTTRNRVEDFSAEVQHRALRILSLAIWTVVGATSLWLALCFAMLTVIFGFGLPPKYAFGIPALVFLVVGLASLVMFKRAKQSRREESDYANMDDRDTP
jgi:uncharacterized membrane protein YqjE